MQHVHRMFCPSTSAVTSEGRSRSSRQTHRGFGNAIQSACTRTQAAGGRGGPSERVPAVSGSRPLRRFSSVDFPLPLGPTMPMRSPRSNS